MFTGLNETSMYL